MSFIYWLKVSVLQWKKNKCRTFLVAPWLVIGLHMFDPWSEKFLHATEQLCLCATSIEPSL